MATPFIATVAIGTALDIRGFATGVGKLRSAASAINGPFGKSSIAVREFNRALRGAEFGLSTLSHAGQAAVGIISGLGAALMKVGRQASVLSLVTGLVGVSIVKSGFNWRKTWNQAKAVTAGTTEEMQKLEELVFDLGAKTKFTVSEVGGAVDFLGKAGNDAVEQLSLLPTMLDLAAAAGTDLPRTADIMTNIAQGLGISLDEVSDHGDMLTATFLNSNVTLEMLADSFKKLGPITKTLNVPFHDMATAIGLMGNAGIQGSEAGVHLRRAMINLSDSMSGMRSEVVDRLGLSWKELDIQARGLTPVLNTLADRLLDDQGQLRSAEDFALASRIFGTRAVSTTLALLGQLRDGYDDLSTSVRNSAGDMRDTAAAQLEGLEPFYRLQAAIELAKIKISESGVLDTFASLAERLAVLFNKLADASLETKRLVFGFLAFTTVAGPVIFLIGLLVTSVAKIGQVFLFLGSVVGFILTPVGLLSAAILAVVGSATYMGIKGVEGVRALFDGSSPIINALINVILGLAGVLQSALAGDWSQAWEYVKDVVANAAVIVMTVLIELVNAMIRMFKGFVSLVADNWEQIASATQQALEWLFTSTEGWLVVFTLLMFKGIRNMAIGVVSRVAWMATQIMLLFIALGKRLGVGAAAKGLWGALWTGMTVVASVAVTGIMNIVRRFGTLFLRVFRIIGLRMAKWGLFIWLTDKFRAVFTTVVDGLVSFGRVFLGFLKKWGPRLSLRVASIVARFANPWVAVASVIITAIIVFKDELWRVIKGIGSVIKTAALSAVEGFVNVWVNGFNSILDGFQSLIQNIGKGWNALRQKDVIGDLAGFGAKIFGVDDDLSKLADFTFDWRVTPVELNDGRSIGEAWEQGTEGLTLADFGQAAKDAWNSFTKPFSEAWQTLKGIGADALDFVQGVVEPMAEFVTAISEGDWQRVGEMAASALNNTVGEAFRFLADVASSFAAGVLDPATKATIKAVLGGLGFVFKELDIALESVKELDVISPEEIKRSVYGILDEIGGVKSPIFSSPEEGIKFGEDFIDLVNQADTPEARKQAALDFISEMVDKLKTTLANVFKIDESGKPEYGDSDNVIKALEEQGFNIDQLADAWKQIEDQYPQADALTPGEDLTGLGSESGSGSGSGVSRSLTGALSDLSLRVLVQIGDQPFEDAVVESLFRARRGGRLEGLTP